MFETSIQKLYTEEDIDCLLEMINKLYQDKGKWCIIKNNTGIFVVNNFENIHMHYLDFILNWLMPTLLLAEVGYCDQDDTNVLFSYRIAIDYDHLKDNFIDMYSKTESVIQQLYDIFLKIMENVSSINYSN
jgi:hypothetical protein